MKVRLVPSPKREAMAVILIPFITCLGDNKSMSEVYVLSRASHGIWRCYIFTGAFNHSGEEVA